MVKTLKTKISPKPSIWQRFRKLSVQKKIIFGILSLFVLLILAIIVSGLIRLLEVTSANATAQAKVTAAREQALESKTALIVRYEAALKEKGYITKTIASSLVDVCYITEYDSGWITNGWGQRCYLRYVRGYEATLTGLLASDLPCQSNDLQEGDNLAAGQIIMRRTGWQGDPLWQSQCAIPDQMKGTLTVHNPASGESTQVLSSFEESGVSVDGEQIWLAYDDNYYTESLGCGIGILCEQPRTNSIPAAIGTN